MSKFNFSPTNVAYSLEPKRYTALRLGDQVWGDNIADAEVVAIWERYRSRMISIPKVELITALTTRFAQLIGNLEDWLKLNFVNNFAITESTQLFIVDCIQFANGGHRDHSISTWYDLVNVKNDGEDCIDRKHLLATTHIPTTEELVSNWLSREGGVDDFFVSINILFGNH